MYSFLPAGATRAQPPEWAKLMTDSLAVVKAKPPDQVLNALATLRSYAAASPDVFTSLTRGERDVKECVALMIALDDAIGAWPLRMRQLISLPPLVRQVSSGENGESQVSVPATTPRGEALVFLLNVALQHLQSGLGYLARVRADTATATSASPIKSSTVVAPNQNAKIAAQYFRQAVEVLNWASVVHAPSALPSAAELQYLHVHLPLEETQAMAVLCAAVAKYMYAISSASTKNKSEVLAKLAFEAAQLPLPPCVPPTSSLNLLPTLLLTAYHHHKSVWYYAGDGRKVPEMGDALAHARHAHTLLRRCEASQADTDAQQAAESESRRWWGRRMLSIFSGGSKKVIDSGSPMANSRRLSLIAGGGRGAGMNNNEEEDGEEGDGDVPRDPVTEYPHLYALLSGPAASTIDLVQVYPYVRLLLHDVCTALSQYEHENRVIYFARVASADVVGRDVPDIANTSAREGPRPTSEAAVFESRADLFTGLPSISALQGALGEQEEVGQAQQDLSLLLQRVEKDGQKLSAYVTPPAALERALDMLEPLVPKPEHWCNMGEVVDVAAAAVEAALKSYETTAAEWQEAYDFYVGRHCAPHVSQQEARNEVVQWTSRATAALEQWKALSLPSTVRSRLAFVEAIVPRTSVARDYVEGMEEACHDALDVLTTDGSRLSLAQVQAAAKALQTVKAEGDALLVATAADVKTWRRASHAHSRLKTELEEVRPAPQYAAAEAVVSAMATALQEAPVVVARLQHMANILREMKEKAVVIPLGRLQHVDFKTPAPVKATSRTAKPVQGSKATAVPAKGKQKKGGAPAKAPVVAIKRVRSSASDYSRTSSASYGDEESETASKEESASQSAQSETTYTRSDAASEKEDDETSGTSSSATMAGVTHAAVSSCLRNRMKANKARLNASASAKESVKKKPAKAAKRSSRK